MTLLVLSVSFALSVSFLCSLLEATLLSYSASQVAALSNRRPRLGEIWNNFKDNIEKPIAVILITNTTAHTIGATIAGAQFEKLYGANGLILFSIVFTYLMLQFTEILPKTLGVRFNETFAVAVARPLQMLTGVLSPVLWFIQLINRPFRLGQEQESNTLKEIAGLAAQARLAQVIDPQHAKMIESASEIEELWVRQIMTPRTQVTFLHIDDPVEHILDVIRRSPYTRFPLCEQDSDHIVGMVHVRDIINSLNLAPEAAPEDAAPEARHVAGAGSIDLTQIKRDVVFLPEHVNILQALRRFQEAQLHLGIVVDEYGATQGIVTLEDVIEEMVGDIRDEFDISAPEMIRREENSYFINGLFPLHELDEHIPDIGIDHGQVDVDTVGGFLTQQFEHLPAAGESLVIGKYRWTVTSAGKRRIREIMISPEQSEETG